MTDTPPPRPPEDDDEPPQYGQRLPGYGAGGPYAAPGPQSPYSSGYSSGYGSESGGPSNDGQPYPPPPGYGPPYGTHPGYGYGPYGGYPSAQPLPRGLAISSLVCGLLALVTFCLPLLPVLFGFVALGLGVAAIGRVRQGRAGGQGMAVTGMVSGGVGVFLGVMVLMALVSLRPYYDDLMRCTDEPSSTNQQQCIEQVLQRWSSSR